MMKENLVLEVITDFLNAIEAGALACMHEKTSKMTNNNSNVFQALQRELKANQGFWKHEGNSYWNHQGDPDVIDRRNSKGSLKKRTN